MSQHGLFEDAFAVGRLTAAHEHALLELHAARAQKDPSREGSARWLLTRVHVAQCDYASAIHQAERGLVAFEAATDLQGQARCLVGVTFAASRRRDLSTAMCAALGAERLSAIGEDVVLRSSAATYTGHVMSLAGDMASAELAFGRALSVVATSKGQVSGTHAHLMSAVGEAIRLAAGQVVSGVEPDAARLGQLLAAPGLEASGGALPYFTVMQEEASVAIRAALWALLSCWQGRLREAAALAEHSVALGRRHVHSLRWFMPYALLVMQQVLLDQRKNEASVQVGGQCIAAARLADDSQVVWLSWGLRLRALERLGLSGRAAAGWSVLLRQGDNGQSVRLPAVDHAPELTWRTVEEVVTSWQRENGITDAEAQVIVALASGQNPPEIASARRTKAGTVRTQLKSVFRKTATGSQVGLLAKLAEARTTGKMR